MKRVFGQRSAGFALSAIIFLPFSATVLTGCGGGSGSSSGSNRYKGTRVGTYRIASGAQAGTTGTVTLKVDSNGKIIGTIENLPNAVAGQNVVGKVKDATGELTLSITDAKGHAGGGGSISGTLVNNGAIRNGAGTIVMSDGSSVDVEIELDAGGTTSGSTTSGSTTSGTTTSGSTTSGTTTSGGTTSGGTTAGNSTSGSTTSGSTTSGTTTSGTTTSGSTTSGTTTSGTTTSGNTTSGGTTSGSTTSGTTSGSTTSGSTTSGSTTAGNTTSGSTTAGNTTSGANTAGNTTTGSTTAGGTTSGATTIGNTTSGSTTAGNTTSGSTTAGGTTSGSTTIGNVTSGSTTAGNTTSGSTTAGGTTSGSTTIGNVTSGGTTAGNVTSGSTTIGGVTSGSTTSGTTAPTFLPGTYQARIQTTNPSTTVTATIPVNSVGTGTANIVNGVLGAVSLSLKVNADGSAQLTIPGLLGAATTADVQLALQPDGKTILGVSALVGPIKGTVTLTKVA